MLSQSHPAELLHFASGLLAVADPRADDPFARVQGAPSKDVTVADLVGSFIDVHVRETTALLTVLAQMIDDDLMARRIRRELARRDDRFPIAKAVGEWFGVGSNPGQRAPALLKAIDAPGRYFADVRLGTPRYLVADRRRGIAETRDRYRPPS